MMAPRNTEVTAEETHQPGKLKAYVEILRPVNCAFGALTVLIGIINSACPVSTFSSLEGWLVAICGLIVYFIVAGASNLINDYFDIDIDKINRPTRPLPRGAISKATAIRYFLLLDAIALVLAAIVGLFTPNPVLIPCSVAFFLFVGYAYARWGKPSGFPGNLMVGAAFSFGIPFGAFYFTSIWNIPALIWFFFITSAFLLISRELVKGMEDIEGDRKFNIKTVANTSGITMAAIVSIVFSVLAIITFTVPAIRLIHSLLFDIFMILGDIAAATSIGFLLSGHPSRHHQKLSSLMLKAGAFLGLIAYVLAPIHL
ncbi:MAG TPA: geranylgeranylglycerol-phosphate geranylgeranyltransferase [Candidatus Lokiarchaeia archaeon]|nr:geranylgeranylglycerol-phosphate geranylgeranyltransferase [Candidatus Lokiarchaeia archaeon]